MWLGPVISAAVATAGTAISTVGTAAMSAMGGITLGGLATGASILGAGLQIVGAATGSKTLSKVGMGFSIAGGLGSVAGALRSGSITSSGVTGAVSGTPKGLLSTGSMDDVASVSSNARAGSQGFKSFNGSRAATGSMDSFKASADSIGVAPGSIATPTAGGMDLDLEKNYFQRANQSLTQYNPLMNIVGGVGEAYMMKERMDLEEKMLDKRLNIDQQHIDRINRNTGAIGIVNPSLGLTRDTQAYSGFLGR